MAGIAGVAGNEQKWLKMAGHGWKLLEMFKLFKWLK